MAAGNEEWRKMADTHKMSPEEVKAGVESSKRPPGQHPGVLHQRRNLPMSTTGLFLGGFLICATIGYFTLYSLKKPEASAGDVARVLTNIAATPEDTKPRKGTSSSAVQ